MTLAQSVFLAMTGRTPRADEIAPAGVFDPTPGRARPTPEQEQAAADRVWDGLFAAAESGCLR